MTAVSVVIIYCLSRRDYNERLTTCRRQRNIPLHCNGRFVTTSIKDDANFDSREIGDSETINEDDFMGYPSDHRVMHVWRRNRPAFLSEAAP